MQFQIDWEQGTAQLTLTLSQVGLLAGIFEGMELQGEPPNDKARQFKQDFEAIGQQLAQISALMTQVAGNG